MRGFDYYTDIAFEVFDTDPDNNRSMFGGGRYDGLVGMFGVDPVATIGFGMGDITLQNFLEVHNLLPKLHSTTEMYLASIGDSVSETMQVAKELREMGVKVAVDTTDKKPVKKIKNALKNNIRFICFVGEEEIKNEQYTLKNLNTGVEENAQHSTNSQYSYGLSQQMTATNHVVTGALIGSVVNSLPVAVVAAFLSHFLLDALPHWGSSKTNLSHGSRGFLIYLASDSGAAAAVLLTIIGLQLMNWPQLLICGVACASPDLMWIPKFLRAQAGKPVKVVVNPIARFHSRIQWAEVSWGWVFELPWFVIMFWLLLKSAI